MKTKITSLKLNNLNDYIFVSNSVNPPLKLNKHKKYIADTGCSGHYDGDTCAGAPTTSPITVKLPNGGTMTSTHINSLDIPSLPPEACTQHLFPEMTTTGLLSIGQLCDHGCTATFSRHRLVIRNSANDIILIGRRIPRGEEDYTNGMWLIQIDKTTRQPTVSIGHTANAVILAETTKADLAKLHHASLGFPAPSTLCDAIDRGFLSSFPGLTKQLVKKHLPKSIQTVKGHLDQERQNL